MPVVAIVFYNESPSPPAKHDPPPGVDDSRPGNGVTSPRLLDAAQPHYTEGAMKAKIQGSVWVECVVDVDGSIRDPHVVVSLDRWFGLDAEAIKAIRLWKFAPGTREGRAVPVSTVMELTFVLR